jgi:hypothetical protein
LVVVVVVIPARTVEEIPGESKIVNGLSIQNVQYYYLGQSFQQKRISLRLQLLSNLFMGKREKKMQLLPCSPAMNFFAQEKEITANGNAQRTTR